MKKIKIKELINSDYAVSMQTGSILNKELVNIWDIEDVIELNFEDLKVIASPFFNASISYLLKDRQLNEIQQKLKFENLPSYARAILNQSIGNALEIYNKK